MWFPRILDPSKHSIWSTEAESSLAWLHLDWFHITYCLGFCDPPEEGQGPSRGISTVGLSSSPQWSSQFSLLLTSVPLTQKCTHTPGHHTLTYDSASLLISHCLPCFPWSHESLFVCPPCDVCPSWVLLFTQLSLGTAPRLRSQTDWFKSCRCLLAATWPWIKRP